MTFEYWWASITQAERNILSEGYARYIWTTAQAAVKDKPKEAENKFEDGQQLRSL
jgi:hypothetical protein